MARGDRPMKRRYGDQEGFSAPVVALLGVADLRAMILEFAGMVDELKGQLPES